MIKRNKTLMDSTFVQFVIITVLIGIPMLCINPEFRKFIKDFVILIEIVTWTLWLKFK